MKPITLTKEELDFIRFCLRRYSADCFDYIRRNEGKPKLAAHVQNQRTQAELASALDVSLVRRCYTGS